VLSFRHKPATAAEAAKPRNGFALVGMIFASCKQTGLRPPPDWAAYILFLAGD